MKCIKCGSLKTKKLSRLGNFTRYYCESCKKKFKIQNPKSQGLFEQLRDYFRASKEKYFWLIFFLISAVYLLTYVEANNQLIVNAFHDDALYFWLGQNISLGNWLGNYMQLTLAKMPSYAMFTAFVMKTGIPYLWLVSLFHIVAVAYLISKSKYLFKHSKWLLLILGFLLLFNPFFAIHLRIYRFQLPAICFLVFIASIVSLFNPSKEKSHWIAMLPESILVFMAWGMLWFSREEYLFYVACLIISVIGFFIIRRDVRFPVRNLLPIAYGLTGILGFWLFISGMNYKHYDRFVTCERTSAPFTDAISAFNSIEDPNFPKNISGSAPSRAKVIDVAQKVPFFRPMSENLILTSMAYRGMYLDTDKAEFIQEPENVMTVSHFEWAWIDAAYRTGYYKDATTLANYYSRLHKELRNAIEENKLLTKKDVIISFGPYTLSSKDLTTIRGLIYRNYSRLFPAPLELHKTYKNILVQTSDISNEKKAKSWSEKLKINYLANDDTQRYMELKSSFSNKLWNISTSIFAFTAMPLIHFATVLAFFAFIISIIRKKWIFAAITAVFSSFFIMHYLIIAVTSAMISYDNAQIAYFLPSYGTMLFSGFVSIGIIFSLMLNIFNKYK